MRVGLGWLEVVERTAVEYVADLPQPDAPPDRRESLLAMGAEIL